MRYLLFIVLYLNITCILGQEVGDYEPHIYDSIPVTKELIDEISKVGFVGRDITNIKENLYYKNDKSEVALLTSEPLPCRGNCEDLYALCDELDVPVYYTDPFDNPITFYGFYGSDARQRYYVYLPPGDANGKVVVLIHGGGWFSGPNPDEVKGFIFKFAPGNSSESLVGDLLDEGYVVVSLLYRLAKFGSDSTEIQSNYNWQENTNPIDRILEDVTSAINHFKIRMSECYATTFNNFHLVGESAGGHIALLYTYKVANPTWVKSVTSMYAPVNFRQFSTYLNGRPLNYSCGSTFLPGLPLRENPCNVSNVSYATPNHNPGYIEMVPSFTTITQNYFDNGCQTADPMNRALRGYNLIQSCMGQMIPTPSSSALLFNYSPALIPEQAVIPTFIMHGLRDFIVPHDQSRFNMNNKLNSQGGLLAQNNVCDLTPMPTLSANQKHLERLYRNVGHGLQVLLIAPPPLQPIQPIIDFQERMYDRVRADIVHWINIH